MVVGPTSSVLFRGGSINSAAIVFASAVRMFTAFAPWFPAFEFVRFDDPIIRTGSW